MKLLAILFAVLSVVELAVAARVPPPDRPHHKPTRRALEDREAVKIPKTYRPHPEPTRGPLEDREAARVPFNHYPHQLKPTRGPRAAEPIIPCAPNELGCDLRYHGPPAGGPVFCAPNDGDCLLGHATTVVAGQQLQTSPNWILPHPIETSEASTLLTAFRE